MRVSVSVQFLGLLFFGIGYVENEADFLALLSVVIKKKGGKAWSLLRQ